MKLWSSDAPLACTSSTRETLTPCPHQSVPTTRSFSAPRRPHLRAALSITVPVPYSAQCLSGTHVHHCVVSDLVCLSEIHLFLFIAVLAGTFAPELFIAPGTCKMPVISGHADWTLDAVRRTSRQIRPLCLPRS